MTYFQPLTLRAGAGGDYKNGLCVMEAVAWMASEGATDEPECACPVLGAFAIRLNDSLTQENRQQLKALILPLTGTRSKDHEKVRAEHIVLAVATRIVSQVLPALREAKTIDEVRASLLSAVRCSRVQYVAPTECLFATNYVLGGEFGCAINNAFLAGSSAANRNQQILLQLIPILQEAINLGPNGADQWPTYEPRAKALGEFAKTLERT
jgi:hypothetical protein